MELDHGALPGPRRCPAGFRLGSGPIQLPQITVEIFHDTGEVLHSLTGGYGRTYGTPRSSQLSAQGFPPQELIQVHEIFRLLTGPGP